MLRIKKMMLAQSIYKEACEILQRATAHALAPENRVAFYKEAYQKGFDAIRKAHYSNHAGGLEVAKARSALMDALLENMFRNVLEEHKAATGRITLIALGGYGRGLLNPYSDVDLLFLTNKESVNLPTTVTDAIEAILYPLWDLGFKVGHASRNLEECLSESLQDNCTLTSLLEARYLCGNKKPFNALRKKFRSQVIKKRKKEYLKSRMDDLKRRYKRYSHTVFLQEPNVKESPGGLRDYQNIVWVANVTSNCFTLEDLVYNNLLSRRAFDELTEAIDFLHNVRNELHYQNNKASDILTLRLQGVVATEERYPDRTILRRTEAFMRDYYLHARAIADRLLSVIETLNILEKTRPTIMSLIPFRKKKVEPVDAFTIQNGLLRANSSNVFTEDPSRLMRVFQICQIHGVELAPELRNLIKNNWNLIDATFRQNSSIAETFQSILERKGNVARILRMMHRVGFLGHWLPEFDALDCLVQHEFFHRYTADEHTLRCIDQLDSLFSDTDTETRQTETRDVLRKLFRNIDDPYALYLALILHDSGRAEDVREHTDGSAVLASRVCTRLGIVGSRRRMITFLVDQHLSFWRFATTRNIEDIDVITEFARLTKNQTNLEALYLFTYVDSLGTNEEAWSSWKDSLMKQLFRNTTRFFKEGDARTFVAHLDEETERLKEKALRTMGATGEEADELRSHYDMLPKRYFRFRKMESIIAHLKTMRKFKNEHLEHPEKTNTILWRDYYDKGYTEFVISAMNQPFFIEKVCCALASQQINILSAEIFTRDDNQILDILRVCTVRHEPVTEARVRKRVEASLNEILLLSEYDPAQYLQRKKNFLTKPQEGIAFPVRALTFNDTNSSFTVVEIQARDRIGLLHDVFHCIGGMGLQTALARIATEKGAALDTIYITDGEGNKIADPAVLQKLEEKLNTLIS